MTTLSPRLDLSERALDCHGIDDDREGQPAEHYDGEAQLLNDESSRVYQEPDKHNKSQHNDSNNSQQGQRSQA